MINNIINVLIYLLFSGCTYYGVLGGLTGTSAIMTIAMMSIERYTCIARPLDPSSRMTRCRALLMVCFIWAYSCVFSLMPIFGINQYVPEGFLTSCSFNYLSDKLSDRIFIMCFFVAAWCVPMIIVCRCYTGIVRCVSENQKMFMHHAENMEVKDRNVVNQRKLEIKLAKISFTLISLWTLSWTPYAVVALLGVFSDRSMLTPFASMIPALFCKAASVFDPFVYGLSNRQFKAELLKKLVFLCKSKRLQSRNVNSILLRTMSEKSRDISYSDEHAEVSLSVEDQQETVSKGNLSKDTYQTDKCDTTKTSEQSAVQKPHEEQESSEKPSVNRLKKPNDSELNNNVGLKRIRVFPIPQVYLIEMHDDIIKLKSRRSF